MTRPCRYVVMGPDEFRFCGDDATSGDICSAHQVTMSLHRAVSKRKAEHVASGGDLADLYGVPVPVCACGRGWFVYDQELENCELCLADDVRHTVDLWLECFEDEWAPPPRWD